MAKLLVYGGNKLHGKTIIPASKNAYLPILAGIVLCKGKVILHNNPKYSDVYNMCEILSGLGAKIEFCGNDIIIDASRFSRHEIDDKKASLLRSSIFTLGSILGRFGKAKVAFPGGCEIGARPIDIHLKGLKALGVKVVERHGYIYCDGTNLNGAEFHLDFPSVGATENLMLASVLARGKTNLYNCAKEPEIVDLENFLNCCGAKIRGAGTNHITICGVSSLHGCEYTPMPDRIVAGTYVLACAICGGEIELIGANKKYLGAMLTKIENNTCIITQKNGNIRVSSSGRPLPISKIETMPYPGFATDLQSQLMSAMCFADGTSVIVENLFENRYNNATELIKMGADITLNGRTAVIRGVKKLYGANVVAKDLRGGVSLVLAGLGAEGYTTVENVHFIDRGYNSIETALTELGAKIKRID